MEKEYITELLGDIDKSPTSDDKLHLMTILLKDLVNAHYENLKVTELLKDNLVLAELEVKELLGAMNELWDITRQNKEGLTLTAQNVAFFGNHSATMQESILQIIKDNITVQQTLQGLLQSTMDINDRIDKIQYK